jgi:hypothetical protein
MPHAQLSVERLKHRINKLPKSAIKTIGEQKMGDQERFSPPIRAANMNYLEMRHLESMFLVAPEDVARNPRTL